MINNGNNPDEDFDDTTAGERQRAIYNIMGISAYLRDLTEKNTHEESKKQSAASAISAPTGPRQTL